MKSRKQQTLIKSLLISKLLINLILLILLIVIVNLFKRVSLISGLFSFNGRILQPNARVKLIINKLHQDDIKIQEGRHDTIVDVQGQVGGVFVWDQIVYLLVHYLGLVVDPLDTYETLL